MEITATSNETNNNSSTQKQLEQPVTLETNKSPKKYNGFLRNNSHKKQNKKPTPNMHLNKSKTISLPQEQLQSENITPVKITIEPPQNQQEYELFNFLRLKTGHNEKKFWQNLELALKEKQFCEIKKSNLSLISYSVLHDSTIVFNELLTQFGKQISQEEFTNCILKFSIHKNPQIIISAIDFYEKNFSIEKEFLQDFITTVAKISYRLETNQKILSWLIPHLDNSLLDVFWNNCLLHNNVPIINQSLQHSTYAKFLLKNIKKYEKSIESIGRKHEIKNTLSLIKSTKKVDEPKESAIINEQGLNTKQDIEPTIWLSDKKEQFKVIQENFSEKKPAEVIIKKKRKIA